MISYRTPIETDAAAIVRFYNFVGGETTFLSFEKDEYPLDEAAQIRAIQGLENNINNIMLMAMNGDEIAGIATISSTHKIKGRHEGELGIVVAKKYQGQGIGSELISRLLAWCRGNGITTRVSLVTRTDNIAAVSLYLKFGFSVEGRLLNAACLNGVYYDLYAMGLFLPDQSPSSGR